MKVVVLALAAFVCAFPAAGHARNFNELNDMFVVAAQDDSKMCAFMEALNRELAVHPEDERLLNLRINAYVLLSDPYSAMADVAALAALRPDSPHHQLMKCMYAEGTGAEADVNRACYMAVADLCEKLGKADEHSQEYLFALLLAKSPKAAKAKERFMAALTDSPMDQALREALEVFSLEQAVKRVDPAAVRRPCPPG